MSTMTKSALQKLLKNSSASAQAVNRPVVVQKQPAKASVKDFRLNVVLSIPSKVLLANGSTRNAMYRAFEIKKYRKTAMLSALAALPTTEQPMLETAFVKVSWYHRTGHRFDPTNIMGGYAVKAAVDGFKDAGIYRDDNLLHPLPPEQFTDKLRPRLEILITSNP